MNLDTSISLAEALPWEVSLELNDTGIDGDNELRQLLSVSKMDLLTALDFFAVDFETDGFDRYHSLNLQYDSAPVISDSYLSFTAFHSVDRIPVPDTTDQIDDVSQGLGAYWMTLTVHETGSFSWGVGIRWQKIDTEDLLIYEGQGENQFLLPGLQWQWQQETSGGFSSGSLLFEWNEPSLADTRAAAREVLVPVNIGNNQTLVDAQLTLDVDKRFRLLVAQYTYQRFLDGKTELDANHHLKLQLGGQSSFGEPLLPSFQRSLGGIYSVRGYDDQVVSGNEVLEVRLEYRLRCRFEDGVGWQPWLFAFYDWGQARREAVDGRIERVGGAIERNFSTRQSDTRIDSIGLGVDIHRQQRSLFAVMAARALADDGVDTESGDWRVHGYLRLTF